MYILISKDGFVEVASWGGILPHGFEVEDFDFAEDIQAYQCVDGEIMLNEERLQQLQAEQSTQEELQQLQEALNETDAVALQWWEESELGLEHEIPEQEFQEVMKKRQDVRTKIRKLREEMKC